MRKSGSLRFCSILLLLLAVSIQGNTTASSATALDCSTITIGNACFLHTLGGNFVGNIAFSPSTQELALIGHRNRATVLSVPDGETLYVLEGSEAFGSKITYSPDSTRLALAGEHGIKIWTPTSGRTELILTPSEATGVAFSPDGTLLAYGTLDGQIGLWDLENKHEIGTAIDNTQRFFRSVISLDFTPDNKWLVTSSGAGTKLWSLPDLELHQELMNGAAIVDFSNDGALLSAASQQILHVPIWEISESGATQASQFELLNGGDLGAAHAPFSHDNQRIAISATDYDVRSPALRIWNLSDGSIESEFLGLTNNAADGVFSHDDSFFAVTTTSGVDAAAVFYIEIFRLK